MTLVLGVSASILALWFTDSRGWAFLAFVGVAAAAVLILVLIERRATPTNASPEAYPRSMPDQPSEHYDVRNCGQGGTAIGKLVIAAPQPEIRTQEVYRNRQEADGFHTRVAVAIAAAYAAESLYVAAQARSVQRLNMSPLAGQLGRSRQTPNSAEPGLVYITVPKPGGQYVVDVVTSDAADDLTVTCQLNAEHATLPKAGDVIGGIGFGIG